MQITVKEALVVKTGTSGKGDWELIRVTSDDNTEYTTFDKGAKHLTKGSVIDIEPVIKEGKCSFKEFKVVSEAPVAVKSNGGEMSKGDWAEKNLIERASIEAQTAYKGIIELMVAKVAPNNVVPIALNWAMSKLGGIATATLVDHEDAELWGDEPQPSAEEAVAERSDGNATESIYDWLNEKMNKNFQPGTARSWILQHYKIAPERIDSEPDKVKQEIAELEGWTL